MKQNTELFKCENPDCGKEHDGSYGSGRFCCVKCKDHAKTIFANINRKLNGHVQIPWNKGNILKAIRSQKRQKRSCQNQDQNFLNHVKLDFRMLVGIK